MKTYATAVGGSLADSIPAMSNPVLVVLASCFIVATGNVAFFDHLMAIYPWAESSAFLISVAVLQTALLTCVLLPLSFGRLAKPVLMSVLVLAAVIAYFQDQLGVIFDEAVIRSVVATDLRESADLLGSGLVSRVFLLGILPAAVLWRIPVTSGPSMSRQLRSHGATFLGAITLATLSLLAFSATYTSFFREHKMVRFYSNPMTLIVASVGMVQDVIGSPSDPSRWSVVAPDAASVPGIRPRLMVLVVGEAARAGNFGINGYDRSTTPHLATRDILSFTNVSSCGTATAVSVPCLFSSLPRNSFSIDQAEHQENLLDILHRTGAEVLWRDNNSDSKGVALRVPFEDFRSAQRNSVCDPECRDTGMLGGLQSYIDTKPDRDILIVLHQMGSHGPAYYKRYPKQFRAFTPTCDSNELSACSPEEIVNTYDNTILYTDHFLDQVISFLESNDADRQTAMVYVGDHGESLGEYGVFLHGMPYMLAPREQTSIPMVLWLGHDFHSERERLTGKTTLPLSHDDVFGTVLSLMGVHAPSLAPARLLSEFPDRA